MIDSQVINQQTMQTQPNGNSPLKIIFLFTMMGVTSYFLIKMSRALISELENIK